MDQNNLEKDRYIRAQKRVKSIKGFYSHALVYVVINLMIMINNINRLDPDESYFQWENFSTLGFWGIGLLAHGLSVFMPYFILGKDWEDRKLKEFLDKEKNSRWE